MNERRRLYIQTRRWEKSLKEMRAKGFIEEKQCKRIIADFKRFYAAWVKINDNRGRKPKPKITTCQKDGCEKKPKKGQIYCKRAHAPQGPQWLKLKD